jgi:hypothetical protein
MRIEIHMPRTTAALAKGGNKKNKDRFAASYTLAPATTEKANSYERVTVDKEVGSSDDIQGSEENRIHKQQSTSTTTNNIIF